MIKSQVQNFRELINMRAVQSKTKINNSKMNPKKVAALLGKPQ